MNKYRIKYEKKYITFIIYSSYIIQIITRLHQTILDGWINLLHKWKEVEPDLVAGVFIFQICTIGYIILFNVL